MAELMIRHVIDIEAPVAATWQVLTDNDYIQQYMFGCVAESDWRPGSPLLWRGVLDGTLYVKGDVVSIDPPHRLEYTVFDPNSTMPDVPANYLTMTYAVTERGEGASTLEITQGDFATVENGQKRYEDSLGSSGLMAEIKRLAEARAG